MRPSTVGTRLKGSLHCAAVAALLVALGACSSGTTPSSGSMLTVTEKDYRISSLVATAPAGMVSFNVHNRGPSTHEFVVFKANQPADELPLGADGLTVDEDSPSLQHMGELSQVDIGRSGTLALRLRPGRYVLVCNLEGHYLGGMYFVVTVH
jgi:uncharacterized cupredoxin-like copper-binding protein